MGKRSDFPRNKHDAYDTPPEAVKPLLPHLGNAVRFVEPCAGSGQLARILVEHGHICTGALDIEPRGTAPNAYVPETQAAPIARSDAARFDLARHYGPADLFITNPPWTRALLHPIILNLYWQRPTWLLLDADWKHTKQACPYMPLCSKIVSVGRVKWIPGSAHTGKDNCAWYLFEPRGQPEFIGRRV